MKTRYISAHNRRDGYSCYQPTTLSFKPAPRRKQPSPPYCPAQSITATELVNGMLARLGGAKS